MTTPVITRWQPRQTAMLHAELTADESTIILIGTGTDADLANMAKWLQLATPLIKPSDPPGALVLAATWTAVVQLSMMFGRAWAPGPRLTAWTARQLVLRTQRGEGLRVAPPQGCEPRPYQVDGALMFAATGRAFLLDDPGTGKTITTILGLVERALVAEVLPVLVIAPLSVVDPWVQAWQTWAPQFRAVAWQGPRRQRLAGTADVYVTTYDTARNDANESKGPLVKLRPVSVVTDEVHLIKSPDSWRSKAARRLTAKAANFAGLSGTPITHNPSDLYPALECLEPLAWPSKERMVNRYVTKVPGDYKDQLGGLAPHTEEEFRTSLLGQHRRVAKADVLSQLPPKVYSVRVVELPPAYRKAYDDMERDMLAQLPDGGELSVMSVLAQLTRLNQLASAAADVTVTWEPDNHGELQPHYHVQLKFPSWKVDALLEVLAERPGEPVVCFAPRRQLVMLAGAAAQLAGLEVGAIVGGQTRAMRNETVEAFQRGKIDLLCVTTGAGGVGLTLTAARTAVFLQRPWSIVEALQAEDRCHRIGSEVHDSIEIIDIVAANTIDSRVRVTLKEKAGQLSDLLQDRRIVAELLGGITLRQGPK